MTDYRLCTRPEDAFAGPAPGSVKDHCSRCQQAIWVCVTQEVTPEEAALAPVCTRCVAADPDLAAAAEPGILHNIKRLHYWADRFRAAAN